MVVAKIASMLIDAGEIDAHDIAIISPYSKQVQLLRTELSARKDTRDIRVGTVDSFQGQETGVVIFSAVRSNTLNELGFLRDPRRLCVAITRAKRGLILVGDKGVLGTCRHWSALLASCKERGCFMNVGDIQFKPKILTSDTPDEDLVSGLLSDTDDLYGLF